MANPYYRAVVLVLASDNDPIYRFFKKMWEAYMFENPNFKVFFTYAGNVKFVSKEYDLIYNDLKEDHYPPDIVIKNLRAMQYIDDNYDYDFFIRTNLSTLWLWDRLLKSLDDLPSENCLAGRYGHRTPPFITGTGLIVNRHMIKFLLQNQQKVIFRPPKYIAEDRIFSDFFMEELNIPTIDRSKRIGIFENFTEINHQEIINKIEDRDRSNVDNFRIKNFRAENRLQIDSYIANILLDRYYNKHVDVSSLSL